MRSFMNRESPLFARSKANGSAKESHDRIYLAEKRRVDTLERDTLG